jgi:hypothetical protein
VTRRRAIIAGGMCLLIIGLVLGATLAQAPADTAPTAAFSKTETITRIHHNADGTDTTADTRTFSVSVDRTDNLRGGSIINVDWSGAHPTLGKVADPNSSAASLTEYPVVLLQCRGDDTAGNPTDPSTCWTDTMDERSHQTSDLYPPWRVDRYETAANKQQVVGYPNPVPADCPLQPTSPTDRFVPLNALDGTVFRPLGLTHSRDTVCGPVLAPEMITVESPQTPPGNVTYGASDAQGAGVAKFVVLSADENASLGCSQTIKCSLVVIPIMGISCDVTGSGVTDPDVAAQANQECRATGRNGQGQVLAQASEFFVDPAVTGEFWWSQSNWRNRVTIPITFGTPESICSSDASRVAIDMFGSELMSQANDQWAPAFCTDPTRYPFRHVILSEPQAKTVVATGGGEVALDSEPPPDPYPMTVVNAPIAVSGFGISYEIDDANGTPYHNLKLTPRLLAKLLTESYPPSLDLKAAYAALPTSDPYAAMASNPVDITSDPEFQALNPGLGIHATTSAGSSSTLFALAGTSDEIFALTSYINADPEARAWLNGAPDPWGMVVNPGYKNISLPVQLWPLLDTFTSPNISFFSSCLLPEQWKALPPQPVGPLVASPMQFLSLITQAVQYARSNSHTRCTTIQDLSGAVIQATLSTPPRQTPGFRFILGLTALGDANFVQLDNAALQSHSDVSNFTTKFTDASNRTFVQPTTDSMKAAMALAKPNETTGMWQLNYNDLRGPQGTGAYPGTLPVFATVPTKGLSTTDAGNIAQFLRFAAGAGQTPGDNVGQLPAGYLPLTAGNGLAPLVSFTLRAADAVAAQDGELPSLSGAPTTTTTTPTQTHTTSPPTVVTNPVQVPPPVPTSTVKVLPMPSSSSPTPVIIRPAGVTGSLYSSYGGLALPILLLVAFGTAMTGALVRFIMLLVAGRSRQ